MGTTKIYQPRSTKLEALLTKEGWFIEFQGHMYYANEQVCAFVVNSVGFQYNWKYFPLVLSEFTFMFEYMELLGRLPMLLLKEKMNNVPYQAFTVCQ